MNELTDEQKAAVAAWIAEGLGLAEVQQRLREQYALTLTYMETRFLVDDLHLSLQDKAVEEESAKPHEPESVLKEDEPRASPGSGLRVTIDRVTQPHALVSGQVTFSDGQRATWMLDQLGRLALEPTTAGYRPTEQDIMAFQRELQRVAQQQGF